MLTGKSPSVLNHFHTTDFVYDSHAGTSGNHVGPHNYLGRRMILVYNLDRVEKGHMYIYIYIAFT